MQPLEVEEAGVKVQQSNRLEEHPGLRLVAPEHHQRVHPVHHATTAEPSGGTSQLLEAHPSDSELPLDIAEQPEAPSQACV